MTEMDVREFLKGFQAEELAGRGILNGGTRLLNNGSVEPLITLMSEHGVSRLEAPERGWSLASTREFQNPRSTEEKAGKLDALLNRGNVFNEQNTSINPHYAGWQSPGEDGPGESAFGLERDLQRALRANIGQLAAGLKIVDDGSEKTVDAGRIDITAEDPDGTTVVIELKAGKADLRAIGQILSYMAIVSPEPNPRIRGILVAGDFDDRVVMAAGAVPNLSLKAYSFQFTFSDR